MEVEPAHLKMRLWISMGKSLAEASGRLQAKGFSPPFGIDPQICKGKKVPNRFLWIAGMIDANPRASAAARRVKLLAKSGGGNKPRLLPPYYLQQTLLIRLL